MSARHVDLQISQSTEQQRLGMHADMIRTLVVGKSGSRDGFIMRPTSSLLVPIWRTRADCCCCRNGKMKPTFRLHTTAILWGNDVRLAPGISDGRRSIFSVYVGDSSHDASGHSFVPITPSSIARRQPSLKCAQSSARRMLKAECFILTQRRDALFCEPSICS